MEINYAEFKLSELEDKTFYDFPETYWLLERIRESQVSLLGVWRRSFNFSSSSRINWGMCLIQAKLI